MTAVEWLQEALEDTILTHEQIMQTIGLFEQAKEMEKQQMKMAQMHYSSDVVGFKTLLENQFEEWYNQTFKSE